MKWVGLTGGIASGKSTVAEILRNLGYSVIDADVQAREVSQSGTPGFLEVVQTFGQEILAPSGELDRRKLGQVVFSDRQKREKLESILHPRIQASVKGQKARLEKEGKTLAFYDVPLLFEKNLENQFDVTVAVCSSPEKQVERLKTRNSLSNEEIRHRLNSQLPMFEKEKRADMIIWNNGSLEELRKNVESFLREVSGGAPTKPTSSQK